MPSGNASTRLIFSLGLHSAAIIAFQLALMQLLSIVQWHHFAYMIISVAMLGFGASGTLLALARERLLRHSEWLIPLLMTLSGLFIMVAFHITRMEIFRFDVYLLFVEQTQFPVLAANYLIYFIPFFTGALAIGLLFIKYARQIGTHYFSNLLGSGVGGVVVLLALGLLHPSHLPPLIGLLPVAAGLLSMPPQRRSLHLFAAGTALAVMVLLIGRPGHIPMSEYKDLARAMNLPDASVVHSKPAVHGFTQVVASPALRFAPALSLSFTGEVPVKKQVYVNGDFFGVIPTYQPGQTSHILDYTSQALPWAIGTPQRLLLLNAAEGAPVSHALTHNPAVLDAVIEHPGVIGLLQEEFAAVSGNLFLHEKVNLHAVQPRNFLAARATADYDLISMPQQEAFGGSVGINALEENYGMTLEAFQLMWSRLASDGMIAVSSWMDYPSRSSLKLLSTLVMTLESQGITSPEKHIAAVRSWGTITFVLKKSVITPQETAAIRQFCHEMFFDPVLLPDIRPEERQQYNSLEDTALFTYIDRIMASDKDFLDEYGFMIHPATDSKPYFGQFLKLSNFRQLSQVFGQEQIPFLELGYLIVVVTLVQSSILALLFIVLPLLKLRRGHRGKGGTLLYFAALGIGYMFVEIILIQRFVLYFGQPVFAISAVISTMLIASGCGSLWSEKLPARPRFPAGIALLVTLGLLAYTFFLTPFLKFSIASPVALKIFLGLLLIGIPSFFKGMLFPLGIRYLSDYDPGQIPWAWGINGSLSVISTSLAMLIAVEHGFQAVMGLGVLCYALAAASFASHRTFFRRAG